MVKNNTQQSATPDEVPGLKDTDPMPWGRYKGIEMQNVPASYFHSLWHNNLEHKEDPVALYVKRCLPALRDDYPDGTW